jgi:DNA-binding NtrC family response regulator
MSDTPHSRRLLVVDDDPEVLALTTMVLRKLPGSEVVACDNPRQALDVFMANPESFEMLVTDFNMPSLDGIELSRRLHLQSPQLHVLLISGGGLETADMICAGLDAFLSKPWQANELLEVVRTVLEKRSDNVGRWTSRQAQGGPRPLAHESP